MRLWVEKALLYCAILSQFFLFCPVAMARAGHTLQLCENSGGEYRTERIVFGLGGIKVFCICSDGRKISEALLDGGLDCNGDPFAFEEKARDTCARANGKLDLDIYRCRCGTGKSDAVIDVYTADQIGADGCKEANQCKLAGGWVDGKLCECPQGIPLDLSNGGSKLDCQAQFTAKERACRDAGGKQRGNNCDCGGLIAPLEMNCAQAEAMAKRTKEEEERQRSARLTATCDQLGGKSYPGDYCECPESGFLIKVERPELSNLGPVLSSPTGPFGLNLKSCPQLEIELLAACAPFGGGPEKMACKCPNGVLFNPRKLTLDKHAMDYCQQLDSRAHLICESVHGKFEADSGKMDAWFCKCHDGTLVNGAMGECCIQSGPCTGASLALKKKFDDQDAKFDLLEIAHALKMRIPATYVVITDLSKRKMATLLAMPNTVFKEDKTRYFSLAFRFMTDDYYTGQCDLDDFPDRHEIILRNCQFASQKEGKMSDRFSGVAPLSVPYTGIPHPVVSAPPGTPAAGATVSEPIEPSLGSSTSSPAAPPRGTTGSAAW